MSIRKPAAAGLFYPGNKDELNKYVNELLNSVETKDIADNTLGAVVPHAGYPYSGKTAAHVYNLLKQNPNQFNLFIIFGANHSEYDKIVISEEDFETPLGIVKNSSITTDILKQAQENNINIIKNGKREHSIEVQLPFLQEVIKNKFEIIPILIRDTDLETCKKLIKIIYNLIKEKDKDRKTFVLASSDFTHYGTNYGYNNKNFEKIDKNAIEKILKFDSQNFLEVAKTATICGASAIICAIELCRLLGAKRAQLLDFTNSAKITDDHNNVVDYAGIVFGG